MPANEKITVRVTPDEYRAIAKKAESYGLDMSSYIRLVSLCAKLEIKVGPVK